MISKPLPPAWLEATDASLRELLALPANWDSYGASSIHTESVMAAADLLRAIMRDDSPAPNVVPTPRGFIQLEWHRDGLDLEIEVRSPGKYSAHFQHSLGGETWDEEIDCSLQRLIDCVAKFPKSKQAS